MNSISKPRLFFGLILFAACAVSSAWGSTPQFRIHSGHQGQINTMQVHPEKPYLFTADDTGVVCVWNILTGDMIHNFQASRYNITRIAVNPELSQVALYETNDQNYQRITLWNWQTEKKSYSIGLREEPLLFDYSAQGTYFFLGFSSMPTLQVYRSSQGRKTDLLNDVLDIVSYGYIGSNENTMMTYSLSGSLVYRKIESGEVIHEAETLEGLRDIIVTEDKRHILARKDSSLLLIDRLTGEEVQRMTVQKMKGFSYHPSAGKISAWGYENQRVKLRSWEYIPAGDDQAASIDVDSERQFRSPLRDTTDGVQGHRALFLSEQDGNIHRWEPFSPRKISNTVSEESDWSFSKLDTSWMPFYENTIRRVYGTARMDNKLYVSTNQGIYRFASDYFDELPKDPSDLAEMEHRILPQPLDGPGALKRLPGNQLLVWAPQDRSIRTMAVIDGDSGDVVAEIELETSLRDLKTYPPNSSNQEFSRGRILYLTRGGNIGIFDLEDRKLTFSYTVRGARSVEFIDSETVVVGSPSSRKKPLMTINVTTGENSSLTDSCYVVFSMAMNHTDGVLYYIGLEERGDSIVTLLKRRKGEDMERSRSLLRHSAEDYQALVRMGAADEDVYTNLGQDRIRLWTGSRFRNFHQARRYPVSLHPQEDRVLSVDEDQSVHIWNSRNGQSLNKLYLFKSGGWVFLPKEHPRFYGSPGISANVTIQINGHSFNGGSSSRFVIHGVQKEKRGEDEEADSAAD